MAWSATEDFESYSDGTSLAGASGGSGWNGNWAIGSGTWTASNLQAQGGTMSGRDSTGNFAQYINRAVPSTTNGAMQVSIFSAETTHSEYVVLGSGVAPLPTVGANVIAGFEGTNIVAYDNVTVRTLLSTFAANTWYKLTINFDGSGNTFTVQVDAGATNGPYAYSLGGSGATTNFQIYQGGGSNNFFFDNIGSPVGTTTGNRGFNLLGTGV